MTPVSTPTFIRIFAASRVALGAWLSAAPTRPSQMWFGTDELPPSNSVLIRSVGARDIGLGLGLAADPSPTSQWLKAGILADVVDATAALLVRERVPRRNFLTGFLGALVYALIGVAIAVGGDTW